MFFYLPPEAADEVGKAARRLFRFFLWPDVIAQYLRDDRLQPVSRRPYRTTMWIGRMLLFVISLAFLFEAVLPPGGSTLMLLVLGAIYLLMGGAMFLQIREDLLPE